MRFSLLMLPLLSLACASAPPRPAPLAVASDPHGEIRFWVYSWDADRKVTLQAWPSIPVYLVSSSGRSLLGHTDVGGHVEIPKDSIWVPGAQALLFCRDSDPVECSSLLVDTDWLRRLDKYNVELPPLRMLD